MTPQFACQLAPIGMASFDIPALLNLNCIHSILGVGDLQENLYFPLLCFPSIHLDVCRGAVRTAKSTHFARLLSVKTVIVMWRQIQSTFFPGSQERDEILVVIA